MLRSPKLTICLGWLIFAVGAIPLIFFKLILRPLILASFPTSVLGLMFTCTFLLGILLVGMHLIVKGGDMEKKL